MVSTEIINEKALIIIPAAGFGTRAGSPLAKEMIEDPKTKLPLIHLSLSLADRLGYPSLMVTRPEKLPLIEYVQKHFPKTEILFTEKTREWPESILKSSGRWKTKNIVVLPDTTFAPFEIIERLDSSLESNQVSLAVHRVANSNAWGCVERDGQRLSICEKPQEQEPRTAWGIFGFRKDIGERVMSLVLDSTFDHKWKQMNYSSEFFQLEHFEDLTRNKVSSL